jgi:hypothetical protein
MYFGETMVNRQRLLWAVATRRQLERWEPIVAGIVRDGFAERPPDGADVWAAEIERHFTLVAARNLFRALDLPPASGVSVDPTVRAELIEGRNLNEHWRENMPIFNVRPRPAEAKHDSGKRFAARNPDRRPYSQFSWTNKAGALLLPNVPAKSVHELLDAVEAEVLAKDASLGEYIPPRVPSPWLHHENEWWPRPDDAT